MTAVVLAPCKLTIQQTDIVTLFHFLLLEHADKGLLWPRHNLHRLAQIHFHLARVLIL